ncbi:uncharacterized protein LOC135378169 isoform X2 [Ornithodoros turicata]|uniref:uncharacterized protein LOC135378169 isoform X2 n=1 Tax=Ornithodoros turicata TaxID=34597 RepID=UPI00313A2214
MRCSMHHKLSWKMKLHLYFHITALWILAEDANGVTHKANESRELVTGASSVSGNSTPFRTLTTPGGGISAKMFSILRRWMKEKLYPSKQKYVPEVPNYSSGTQPPDLTAHTHVPIGLTRDPTCNMSAFVRLLRECWKAASVYSTKPDGQCSLKVNSLFRRCVIRIQTATSCSDDERAQERVSAELDSQFSRCPNPPNRRSLPEVRRNSTSSKCSIPGLSTVVVASFCIIFVPH